MKALQLKLTIWFKTPFEGTLHLHSAVLCDIL